MKDLSDLHVVDGDRFRERLQALLDRGVPWEEQHRLIRQRKRSEAWAACADLAREPMILDLFARDVSARLVGADREAKLLYLVVTSRLLPRPVSCTVKGPSSAGKSYLVERVLDYFPASAYYALTAMSEHALAYSEEPLRHRMLVLYEAAGLQSKFATYLVRSLLSEGRLRYETVEKTSEGMKARMIEREGPSGLIATTTRVSLHPENETRLISLRTNDTPEQTSGILGALAIKAEGLGGDLRVDPKRWHGLQRWLAENEVTVTIPYANVLASLIPPVAVRLRRDFSTVLSLIQTHAILHQATRERTPDGRIVATVEDFAVVRELVLDLIGEGVDVTVSVTVRDTVEAVRVLLAASSESDPSTSQAALANHLRLDKAAVSRRVREATERGYLVNLAAGQRGKAAKLILGEPLPDDIELLPTVEALANRCSVDSESQGHDTPLPPLTEDERGRGVIASSPSGEVAAIRTVRGRRTPLPGDPNFRDFLKKVYEAGHITERERHERRISHNLVCRANGLRR